jgi:ABC-2 type transport system ATP-binding protein
LDLLALDGVRNVRQRDGGYLLEVSHAHRTVPALLAFLSARAIPLEELSTHSATLDDVFVHLTGRQLRDV